MTISKVATSSSLGTTNKSNSAVEALEKQKAELSKQIAEVKASKQDSKTKAEKIKNLTTQIADIDQQIIQANLDAKQREIKEAQEKAAEKAEIKKYERETDENNQGVILSPSLNKLLAASKNSSELKTMDNARRKLNAETSIAQTQIKYAVHGSIQYQLDVIISTSSKLSKLESDMALKMEKVQKDLKSSVKLGIKEAENTRKNKDEIKEDRKDNMSVSNVADNGDITIETEAAPIADTRDSKSIPEYPEDKKDKKRNQESTLVDVMI